MTIANDFFKALEAESPLQIAGTINAYCALLAKHAGFKCLYLSGAGVANASFGLADLGLTHLDDVVDDARRITSVCDLPLLVDIDTGFSHESTSKDLCEKMIDAGVAAIQIEDQQLNKRCGHRDGKKLVSSQEMQKRLQSLKSAVRHNELLIMARTDAYDVEGLDSTIQRCIDYQSCGVDMIFAESIRTLEDYKAITDNLTVPVLANITEFGKTPMFTVDELRSAGIRMVLYPLSAFRAMNKSALDVYRNIKLHGTQSSVLQNMQTRDELYKILNYYKHEDNQN